MMTLLRFRCERPGDYCRSAATRLAKARKLTGKFFPIFAAASSWLAPGPAQTSEPKSHVSHRDRSRAGGSLLPRRPRPSPRPAPRLLPRRRSRPTPRRHQGHGGTGSALIPHDLSPYGMFMNADVVVKAVMIGLAFASLVTWTLLLAKAIELTAARRRAQAGLGELARAQTLGEAASRIAQERYGGGAPRARPRSTKVSARRASAPRASRSAPPRCCRASRRAPAAPWAAAPGCSPPSAPPRPSSACSARSGAS